jgi:hypothetical protein
MVLGMDDSIDIYKYHRYCVELGKMKFNQKALHNYGFFLISSSQSKSNASSSSSGKVKRELLERISFSVDVCS